MTRGIEQHWRMTSRNGKVVSFFADEITMSEIGRLGFKRNGQIVAVFDAGSWAWGATNCIVERTPRPDTTDKAAAAWSMVRVLRKALETVEWVIDVEGSAFCPWCSYYREAGHAPDCMRELALDN